MGTKKKVLEILSNSQGYVSGAELAKVIGVTRNSVWKAVSKLKCQGYEICADSNGYKLIVNEGAFDEINIKRYLKNEHSLYIYKEETSSNTVAKALCQKGENEGSVVIVESQTAGRGRMGRSFLSSSENGLYMSIILRPKIKADKCVALTVACAVAVAKAIEETSGIECGIKWVNDIYIGGKKCCGILTEASLDFETGGLEYAIVGIGVNLCPPTEGFHEEIKEIACGVYEKEYPKGYKSKLCASIINNFFDVYSQLEEKKFIKLYKEKSIIIGNMVDVYVGDRIVSGIATDIDEDACLIVTNEKGEKFTFNSGEARVRKSKI